MADGVETVVVTSDAIGSLIHRMGYPALRKEGRPEWSSFVVVVSEFVGVGLEADWVYVEIAAVRLVK